MARQSIGPTSATTRPASPPHRHLAQDARPAHAQVEHGGRRPTGDTVAIDHGRQAVGWVAKAIRTSSASSVSGSSLTVRAGDVHRPGGLEQAQARPGGPAPGSALRPIGVGPRGQHERQRARPEAIGQGSGAVVDDRRLGIHVAAGRRRATRSRFSGGRRFDGVDAIRAPPAERPRSPAHRRCRSGTPPARRRGGSRGRRAMPRCVAASWSVIGHARSTRTTRCDPGQVRQVVTADGHRAAPPPRHAPPPPDRARSPAAPRRPARQLVRQLARAAVGAGPGRRPRRPARSAGSQRQAAGAGRHLVAGNVGQVRDQQVRRWRRGQHGPARAGRPGQG